MEQDPGLPRTPDAAALGGLPVNAVVGAPSIETPGLALLKEIQQRCPELEIREEQVECLDAMQGRRDVGDPSILIHMATGLGKTTVVAADAWRFVQQKPGTRILFLSHQNHIGRHARQRFERVFGPDYVFGEYTGNKKDAHETDGLFASLQVMALGRHNFDPREFGYVVVDESHHGAADTFEPVIRYFQPDCLVGVTGTPDRMDPRDIREIFGEEDFSLPLPLALARNLLTQVDYRVLTDDLTAADILRKYENQSINLAQLNRTLFLPRRDAEMARLIKKNAEEIEGPLRRVIFCNSIADAEEFKKYFGDQAKTLHSEHGEMQQMWRLEGFRGGEFDTLLVVDIMNEGIDVPEINQVVFRRKTKSKPVFYQQLGRGLRKIAGKKLVQVLDFAANCERLALINDLWLEVSERRTELIRSGKMPETAYHDTRPVQFSQSSRKVLDVLASIGAGREVMTAEKAKEWYVNLCTKLGYMALIPDIEAAEGPALSTLVAPFGGRLSNLRLACGMETGLRNDWTDWSKDRAAKAYREICGEKPLARRELDARLRDLANKLPSITVFLAPFTTLTALQIASGYEPTRQPWDDWTPADSRRVYRELSGETALPYEELAEALKQRKDLPSIHVVLRDYPKIADLQTACGYEPLDKDWSSWTAADSEALYRRLSGETPLSKLELAEKLDADPTLPSLETVLRTHKRRMRNLQTAAGFTPNQPDWSQWTEAQTVAVYQEFSGGTQMGAVEFEAAVAAADRDDIPSGRTMLDAFRDKGGIVGLQKAAGFNEAKASRWEGWTAADSVRVYRELSGDKPLGRPLLRQLLTGRDDLPSLNTLLAAVGGKMSDLKRAAGYE